MKIQTILMPLAFAALTAALTVAATAGAENPTGDPAASPALQDLCAELDEFGNPARCVATGPDMAPWWDAEVCCDARTCVEPTATGCGTVRDSYWCESAELHADGTLSCVYEVPSYCEVFPCEGPTDITHPPLEHAICCYDIGCYDHEGGLCGGLEIWCGKGASNMDGTVDCFD